MNLTEIQPEPAPIGDPRITVPEPVAWKLAAVALAVVLGWRCEAILMGGRERTQGVCFWSLGSMPVPRRRRFAGWILGAFVALLAVAIAATVTLALSQP